MPITPNDYSFELHEISIILRTYVYAVCFIIVRLLLKIILLL